MRIPKGWRRMHADENVRKGDMFWSPSLRKWRLSFNFPGRQCSFTYIREVPKEVIEVAPFKVSRANVTRINKAFNRMAKAMDHFAAVCARNHSPVRLVRFTHPRLGEPHRKLSVRYKGRRIASQYRPVL